MGYLRNSAMLLLKVVQIMENILISYNSWNKIFKYCKVTKTIKESVRASSLNVSSRNTDGRTSRLKQRRMLLK